MSSSTDLAVLDRVSAELNRLAGRAGWQTELLRAITGIDELSLEPRAMLFRLDGSELKVAAQLGHTDAFRRLHEGLRVGDCLCGAVARSGQIITSLSCEDDCRHTIAVPNAEPHGHIVVPLKAAGTLVGVLCVNLPEHREVKPSVLKTLTLLGEQLGLALRNEELTDRLESEQLRDPLLDLPSERSLRLVGQQQIEEARRYGHALSLISAAPSAPQNPPHAPAATSAPTDDLAALAALVDRLTRKVDLTARCGSPTIDVIALLPKTPLQAASVAAERIQHAAAAEGRPGSCIGIAALGADVATLDELIARARAARARAQALGGDRVELADA